MQEPRWRIASTSSWRAGRDGYFTLFLRRRAVVFGLRFLVACFFARSRRRISSGEYMLPRQLFEPQLQRASSSSPS